MLGKAALGRTRNWMMLKIKWLTTQKNYENSSQNIIYKIITSEEDHYFKDYLLKSRSIRNKSQNKVGTHDQIMGQSIFTQKSFLYTSIELYNNLPKNLTLIKQQNLFKKWVKLYNLNNNIKLKNQEDNTIEYTPLNTNLDQIRECYEMNEIENRQEILHDV